MRAAPVAYNFYLYELENSSNEFWLGFFVFHAENCKIEPYPGHDSFGEIRRKK